MFKTVAMKQSTCQLSKKRSCKHGNHSVTGLQCSAEESEGFYLSNASLCTCIQYRLPKGPHKIMLRSAMLSAEPTTWDSGIWMLMLFGEALNPCFDI